MDLPFSPPTATWFGDVFPGPTRVQSEGWPVIAGGAHALLLAPTGSGKTLAAFLVGIDRCLSLQTSDPPGVRVVYVSPLKALVVDVERNLRAPLMGVQRSLPEGARRVRVDVRTGDTAQEDRRRFQKDPAEILVTTPESLYLLLTSEARSALRTVHTVIVDEIHAVASTKRGAHLALSLERLERVADGPVQRIGLSATVRPLESVARFLGGVGREVRVVDTSDRPALDLEVTVPVDDMDHPVTVSMDDPVDDAALPQRRIEGGMWPVLYPRLLELVRAHSTTLIFTNSRLITERLCAALNELAGEEVAKAHHGSVSHARRAEVEDDLKRGRIPCIVATSSLELGIDMGAIDLVIQVASPGSSARGLQRAGRAGHQVGAVSKSKIFPKFKGELIEAAVVAERMVRGELEPIEVPRCPLDVLAQQVVADVAMKDTSVLEVESWVRCAWPFRDLSRELLCAVLDLLDGRYPSDDLADLRPRLVWDRATDGLSARRGARLTAVLNAGTIPDRGMFAVHLPEGPRIGELDEEMVYESREGDRIILGASTWRIDEITRDRVIVVPAPGEPGRMPFWRGEGPGRPVDLGRAIGRFVREVWEVPAERRLEALRARSPLDERAARNLLDHLEHQREVTGTLPTDRAVTVECFRDEIGDWRVCLLTPLGGRVHAPWALAIQQALAERTGFEVQALWTDDGVVVRFADAEELPDLDQLFPDPDEVEERVVQALRGSALFAARFRENAARSLLMPKKRPGRRTPLWAQRRRGEALLASTSQYPGFPVILETYRECLQDVFDVPALREVLAAIADRRIRVDIVHTQSASPFSRGLVFAWVANYLYETDTPLAERRAQALTLDRDLLRDLLGQEGLRDLLDPEAVALVEAELQALTPDRKARDADELVDLLRRLGDLDDGEVEARCDGDFRAEVGRRAVRVRIASEERWVAADDVARYRDALGVVPPGGVAAALLGTVEKPLESLLVRWARTHGPFVAEAPAHRWGLPPAVVRAVLDMLVQTGALVWGQIRPGGTHHEYCHAEVLRRLKRVSLARLRQQVTAVDAVALARFLPAWQGLGGSRRAGVDRLREVVGQLEGVPLPYSALEQVILPSRVPGFEPSALDVLGAMGELAWIGRGALGQKDGRVILVRRDRASAFLPPEEPPGGPVHTAILEHLATRGASFLAELLALGAAGADTVAALWDLVWAGRVTNDTFQPLRALGGGSPKGPRGRVAVAGGRWGLVSRLGAPISETEQAVVLAQVLLARYGVVAREMAQTEDLPGGFQRVYKVLRAMEEAGQARRGWFVDGLGGAQFATPGAVDRLRGQREGGEPEVLVLSAVDPALAWGGILPWPPTTHPEARLRRLAGAVVVLVDGQPIVFADRGGRTCWTFAAAGPEHLERAARALGAGRRLLGTRGLRIELLDGLPARQAPAAAAFLRSGFAQDHQGIGFIGG